MSIGSVALQLTAPQNYNQAYTLFSGLSTTNSVTLPSLDISLIMQDASSTGGYINCAIYYKITTASDDVTIAAVGVPNGFLAVASSSSGHCSILATYTAFLPSGNIVQNLLYPNLINQSWINSFSGTFDIVVRFTTGTFSTTYSVILNARFYSPSVTAYAPLAVAVTDSYNFTPATVYNGAQRVQITDSTNNHIANVDSSGYQFTVANINNSYVPIHILDSTNTYTATVLSDGTLQTTAGSGPAVQRVQVVDSTNTYIANVTNLNKLDVVTVPAPLRVQLVDPSNSNIANISVTGQVYTQNGPIGLQHVAIYDSTNSNAVQVDSSGHLLSTADCNIVNSAVPVHLLDSSNNNIAHVDSLGRVVTAANIDNTINTNTNVTNSYIPVQIRDSTNTLTANVNSSSALVTTGGGGGGGGGDVNLIQIAGIPVNVSSSGILRVTPTIS